jgi:hypothetical protein
MASMLYITSRLMYSGWRRRPHQTSGRAQREKQRQEMVFRRVGTVGVRRLAPVVEQGGAVARVMADSPSG